MKFTLPASTGIVLFLCQLALLPVNLLAQADPIKTALAEWQKNHPQEKVFLQTDKTHYLVNDEIWMKAWCMTSEGPTFLSRILYIDLVDMNGKVVQKKMYRLDSLGSTAADMTIPSNLASGNYSLNAYTLWMLNFPEFVFRKNLFIYGGGYSTQAKKPKSRAQLKMQFFPEGGDMIAGVENRIAFKATDDKGFPFDCNGYIEDEAGTRVADIATEHAGLGATEFLVEPNKKYTAVIASANGSNLRFGLPASKTEGIGIKINNSNPNRLFVVVKRAEAGKEKYNELKVVAQMNYQLVHSANLNIDEGQTAVSIPKKNLPPGIMQITVFDRNNRPLAERIAFIENYQLLQPDIKPEIVNMKTKGRNRINFTIDSVGPVTLSCLVTSYDSAAKNEDNLAAAMLFGSEIKGPVHYAGYYLRNKDAVTLHHLDLLLMTQGWRRFSWPKLLANEPVALKYPVESAISFRGTVHKSDRKEVVKDGKVSFIIRGVDSTSILAEATVTDKGEFLLPDIHYLKKAEIAFMGTNNKKESFIVDVKLLPNYIDSLSKSAYTPTLDLDTIDFTKRRDELLAYLRGGFSEDTSRFKTLSGVTVRAKKLSRIDSLNNEYASGVFQMGKSVDPTEFPHYSSVWQMLQATVPGIDISGNPFDPTVSFTRFSGMETTGSAPLEGEGGDALSVPSVFQERGIAYFINEINVGKDVINSLSVDDIALIKVLKNEAASLGAPVGAIAFYTKGGISISARPYDKSYSRENREGYAIQREFYAPDYTDPSSQSLKDNRYTLYWNGRIKPAKDGKYRFEFFNNDFSKKVRLLIQGIDEDGQLIYKEMIIQ